MAAYGFRRSAAYRTGFGLLQVLNMKKTTSVFQDTIDGTKLRAKYLLFQRSG
jgi:hypothetical protein